VLPGQFAGEGGDFLRMGRVRSALRPCDGDDSSLTALVTWVKTIPASRRLQRSSSLRIPKLLQPFLVILLTISILPSLS
jgi:hypothetical protein